jgi:hypothetical protein
MRLQIPRCISITFLFCLLIQPHIAHSADPDSLRYENKKLLVALKPRTPQQMAAFYAGRGFTQPMIDILKQQCFITVFIKNKSQEIIWLDLSRWRFSNEDGEISRPHRDVWKQRWQQMAIPLAHQSTFRWTLLPEELDFQPDEREGGNLVLPRLGKSLTIHAEFPVGEDRSGASINVDFQQIQCATDP